MAAQAPRGPISGPIPGPAQGARDTIRAAAMRARRDAAQRAYAPPLTPGAVRPPRRSRLRLVGIPADGRGADQPAPPPPITDMADPRWVLALRTAGQLEGAVLPPDRRDNLLRLARVMGLTVFDANLIIAIVQDQARRGKRSAECVQAGEPQLRMILRPTMPPWWSSLTTPRTQVTLLAAVLLTAEMVMLWWLF